MNRIPESALRRLRHRATAKVVAWPSGSAARQYNALPDRHGSLRRRTSPEPQTRIAMIWRSQALNAAASSGAFASSNAETCRNVVGGALMQFDQIEGIGH
jgi:hypothetical protein